jgi:hypothetical protein
MKYKASILELSPPHKKVGRLRIDGDKEFVEALAKGLEKALARQACYFEPSISSEAEAETTE